MARLRSGTARLPIGRYRASWGKAGSATLFRLETGLVEKVSPLYRFLTFFRLLAGIPHTYGIQGRPEPEEFCDLASPTVTRLVLAPPDGLETVQ